MKGLSGALLFFCPYALRNNSGSLAILAAIRRASSVSSFAADLPRPFHPAQFHVRSARREIFY
jgi:hypothetical protein